MPFLERDVVADPEALRELREVIGRMATPTILIGGQVLIGFAANRARIEELLRKGGFVADSAQATKARRAPVTPSQRAEQEEMDRAVLQILRQSKTIAVVGLSPDPERPSHQVAAYLQAQGYRVIPVNPQAERILGERSYPDLASLPERVDVVDIFRRPEHVPAIVEAAIARGIPAIWMQLGIVHEEAARRARAAGLLVVMDRCMQQEHMALKREGKL